MADTAKFHPNGVAAKARPVRLVDADGAAYVAEGLLSCVDEAGAVIPWPRPGFLRCVAISDTHDKHGGLVLPRGDALLHAGDYSSTGTTKQTADFVQWIADQDFEHKVFIAGNHDITMHKAYYDAVGARRFHTKKQDADAIRAMVVDAKTHIYLEDSGADVAGLAFYGSPWQPEFCEWAFNLDPGPDLAAKWDLIPDRVDVLLTHGPAYGIGDQLKSGGNSGCVDLLRTITQRVKPQVSVVGHIHEAAGVWSLAHGDGEILFVNASTCTFS